MSSDSAPLDWKDIKTSAAKFSIRFKNAEKEESYKQIFWSEFLAMFGIDSIQVGMFEQFVRKIGNDAGEIDYFWPGKVIIEHKSAGKNLEKALDQALDYMLGIEKKELPRYIIVSDFKRIRLIDLVDHRDDTIKLEELADNVELFGFLAGYNKKRIEGQHPVNVKAAEVMGRLYDELKESNYPQDSLDILMVRLVFCLFAEDADVFDKNIFSAYLAFHTNDDGSGMAGALTEIFSVLNTPLESRQKAMSDELRNFPYVNGGLFAKQIPAPAFNREMRDILLGASKLDWKYISPAIFGSLFQYIMDPSMRRELGAHYTSEENILKLINPLFMDELREELEIARGNKKALRALWDKISEIRILDPACGCGNFLIISYREMRRLEMEIFDQLYEKLRIFDESHLHIDHYYGIEIGEFPSMVANLSIILMDHLMNTEMRNRFGQSRDILPLREKANIICANSLRYDWKELVDPSILSYIVGNPPFVGSKLQSKEQKMEMLPLFDKKAGSMDYVSAWYVKAADYMQSNKDVKAAFVSTSSITQGEQVEPLWGPLFKKGIIINFAYLPFKWNNEAKGVAAVHVVIVSFSYNTSKYTIFKHSEGLTGTPIPRSVCHINAYLAEGPDIFLEDRSLPLCDAPVFKIGNKPIDNGHYLFTEEEKEQFVHEEPESAPYFKRWYGAEEYLHDKKRYCLWLARCPKEKLRTMPKCMQRVKAVSEYRRSSKSPGTQKIADTPLRFHVENFPEGDYLVVPEVSSENRDYIPIGFMTPEVLCSNKLRLATGVTLYHFGIMTSRMHMVWVNYVCGRLKSDYDYSIRIVYNNYPWPEPNPKQEEQIAELSKKILEARSNHPELSLAKLYDPLLMPEDLIEAHHNLDRAVDRIYKSSGFKDDGERIAWLFELYNDLARECRCAWNLNISLRSAQQYTLH
ncbi:MAG: class I SAM-dependent DNA methyltransferase [Thermoplasmata archaeon]|nr:class I SAM-dependent DNA methyltransferase [Thermoplasmata archaeon]